jgi:hypothetical protein
MNTLPINKNGCKYMRDCDECKTPKCRVEYPTVASFKRKLGEIIIQNLYEQGYTVWYIAYFSGMSDKTIRRIVNK